MPQKLGVRVPLTILQASESVDSSHFLIRGTLSKCEQKPTEGGQGMSKVGLGTIKNELAASDLPLKGPKKKELGNFTSVCTP